MSRTEKKPAYRKFSREAKPNRKRVNRETRKRAKQALHAGAWDALILEYQPRTAGWETY